MQEASQQVSVFLVHKLSSMTAGKPIPSDSPLYLCCGDCSAESADSLVPLHATSANLGVTGYDPLPIIRSSRHLHQYRLTD